MKPFDYLEPNMICDGCEQMFEDGDDMYYYGEKVYCKDCKEKRFTEKEWNDAVEKAEAEGTFDVFWSIYDE